MKVLHIHSGNLYGGVETMMITLARYRHFSPAMEMHFALCFDGRLSAELEAAGAPVHRLGNVRTSRPLSIWRVRQELNKLLTRQSFDVAICHSCWTQPLFGPIVRAAKLPLIFWLHGEAKGRHWLERWAKLTRPNFAICNSQFTAGTIDKLYPGVETTVFYCPVAPPELIPTPSERRAVRAELNTPEDATVIIQVSRIEPLKGQSIHLRTLGLLRDLPNWVCWQVGGAQRPREQRYFAQLKSMAERLGIAERVRFLGQRFDVPQLLAAADVYCQPNTEPDAFGVAFIEAMHARLPVVTTAIGGACEIVEESCGILTPPGDMQTLADALRRLIEDRDLRSRLSATGSTRAHQLCDPKGQLRKLQSYVAARIEVNSNN